MSQTVELWQALILGAFQGLTEFLPVSSSGHLVLLPALFGWESPPLAFDVALHWATAAAVVIYFRDEWIRMAGVAGRAVARRELDVGDPDFRLLALIVIGTLPAVVIGLAFNDFVESVFKAPRFAAAMLVVTGVILVVSEALARRHRPDADGGPAQDVRDTRSGSGDQGASMEGGAPGVPTVRQALAVGCAQAAAILPGISRSGSTIAAGLALGMPRDDAARFSFLLATPAIVGAGILELRDLSASGVSWSSALAGMLVAFVVGYGSIGWMLAFVRNRSLHPFAAYVVLIGLLALAFLSRG